MDESELIHEVNVAVEEAIRLFNENHPGADREQAKNLIIQIGEVVKEKNYTKALALATKAQTVARGTSATLSPGLAQEFTAPAGVVPEPVIPPVTIPPTKIPEINIPGITSPEPQAASESHWMPPGEAMIPKSRSPLKAMAKMQGFGKLPWMEVILVVVVVVAALLVWFFLPF